ncbi:hypothetical protein L1856_04440 [Streptomyces sp. Tue 6430]|nr:hypothetical protein [Streptomyces sp. Tue 6430]
MAATGDLDDADLAVDVELGQPPSGQIGRQFGAVEQGLAVAEADVGGEVAVQQHPVDPVHGPADAGDGGDAELAVDVRAAGS